MWKVRLTIEFFTCLIHGRLQVQRQWFCSRRASKSPTCLILQTLDCEWQKFYYDWDSRSTNGVDSSMHSVERSVTDFVTHLTASILFLLRKKINQFVVENCKIEKKNEKISFKNGTPVDCSYIARVKKIYVTVALFSSSF